MANIERTNDVAYYLESTELGRRLITQEPDGWDKDNKSWERDKDSKSIPSKISIDLVFYGDAAEYLNDLVRGFGLVKCKLTKYEVDPIDPHNRLKFRYSQEIDLKTLQKDQRTGALKVKATEGGLYQDIKQREDEDYDLINDKSADGDEIGALKTYPFTPQPRSLFKESKIEGRYTDFRLNSGLWDSALVAAKIGVPMDVVYNSDEENIQNVFDAVNTASHHGGNSIGDPQRATDQFFLIADRDLTLKVKFKLDFTLARVDARDSANEVFEVQFRTSEGENLTLKSFETLLSFDPIGKQGQSFTVDFNREIEVKKGESLSFVLFSYGFYNRGAFEARAKMDLYFDFDIAQVIVQDETPFRPTVGKCVKMLDVLNRLAAKITGKNNLVTSSLFGSGGDLENVLIDNGLWARGVPDVSTDQATGEKRYTQLVTNWKDALKACEYWRPIAWGTYIDGGEEKIYVEDAKFTQQNFTGVNLGEVDNLKTKTSPKNFFKSIEIGMSKEMDYEEINGLEETNGKAKFSTFYDRADQVHSVLSPYRIDPVGYELTRRQQYEDSPTEDTKRDEDIFMHDGKPQGIGYTHRLWTDDFSQLPEGIFDPATAWNLRLSPVNRLFYGHGYSINRCLSIYPLKTIRFISSNANTGLVTYTNGKKLEERGEILVSDLELPRIVPHEIEIEFRLTKDTLNQLEGSQSIVYNGQILTVPNIYGRIEATYKGNKYYGRLTKAEAKDKAKLTLIEVFI